MFPAPALPPLALLRDDVLVHAQSKLQSASRQKRMSLFYQSLGSMRDFPSPRRRGGVQEAAASMAFRSEKCTLLRGRIRSKDAHYWGHFCSL